MRNSTIIFTFILVIVLSACTQQRGDGFAITIKDPWARAAMVTSGLVGEGEQGQMQNTPIAEMGEQGMGVHGSGSNSAAYMVLRNSGASGDKLIQAKSDAAEAVELHISEVKDGVMSMHPVEFVEVPAGGQAELKPGGLHVMLIGLKQDLKPGDKIQLTLIFEKAGSTTIEVPVRAP